MSYWRKTTWDFPRTKWKGWTLLDLIARFRDEKCQWKNSQKKLKAEDNIAKAQDMREKVLEIFGESKKRKDLHNCDGGNKRA